MKSVIEIKNVADRHNFTKNNDKVVIFYGSHNCGHCRNMESFYEMLAAKYPFVAFGHVETTNVKTVNTDAVPVFVSYVNDIPVKLVLGADKEGLTEMIENL